MQNPQWRSRLRKDPGIPNLFPFKDKILAEIEEKKRLKAERAQSLREAAKAKRNEAKDEAAMEVGEEVMDEDADLIEDNMEEDEDDESNPMAALLASAQARAVEFGNDPDLDEMDEDDEDDESVNGVSISQPAINYNNIDSSRRAFDKIFKQVLEAADVILYVLDARDPEGTRSKEVERQVMAAESGSKRLILVLNKIDLVPPPALKGWLSYLRRYFPTIPLRASTPASNARTFDHQDLTVKGTSETLLRALKSYAASKQLKRSVTVGVIGYPNVGKSSVINSLTSRLSRTQSSACPVGAEAGVTTSLREVKVDNKLKVLDSPGIVFPSESASSKTNREAQLILTNALPPKHITDPVPAVTLLLSRLSSSPGLHEKLLQNYDIVGLGPFAKGDATSDFLIQVARKRGRLGKGGVPNLNAAAMTVIADWRDGRIEGWTEPPVLPVEIDGSAVATVGSAGAALDRKEVVKEWAAEFKLDD